MPICHTHLFPGYMFSSSLTTDNGPQRAPAPLVQHGHKLIKTPTRRGGCLLARVKYAARLPYGHWARLHGCNLPQRNLAPNRPPLSGGPQQRARSWHARRRLPRGEVAATPRPRNSPLGPDLACLHTKGAALRDQGRMRTTQQRARFTRSSSHCPSGGPRPPAPQLPAAQGPSAPPSPPS